MGVEEKIKHWCQFDSDVGFGRFILNQNKIRTDGTTLKYCEIALVESYLSPSKDTVFREETEHRFCSFKVGYIKGVFNMVFPLQKIFIYHFSIGVNTLTDSPRSESCLFVISGEKFTQKQIDNLVKETQTIDVANLL